MAELFTIMAMSQNPGVPLVPENRWFMDIYSPSHIVIIDITGFGPTYPLVN